MEPADPGFEPVSDSPRAAELLERHRPILRFDPQYDYRVLAAESAVGNPGNVLRRSDGEVIARANDRGARFSLSLETLITYPGGLEPRESDCLAMAPAHLADSRRMEWEEAHNGRIYGRVKEDGDRTWLQYWFWLYYNPKNLLGFGKHEGDWEMIQIGLGADGEPEVATYAQHNSGEARRWQEGEIELSPADRRRPVVYVAPLSHASYFEPNTHPYFFGIDHPYRNGPAAADLPIASLGKWAEWIGHWGSTERRIARGIGGGPRSPGRQNPKWDRPAAWHERMRRRRWRAKLGRAMHLVGGLTFPPAPQITEAQRVGDRVRVRWQLGGSGVRRARHIYVTVHERHFVIASGVVEDAAGGGPLTMAVPDGARPTAVLASAYNRLRQRSDIARRDLAD